jgi:hypothetical protein
MENQQQATRSVTDPNTYYRACTETFRVWLEFYTDTGWQTDPIKRRAMILARLAYQSASLSYQFAERQAHRE